MLGIQLPGHVCTQAQKTQAQRTLKPVNEHMKHRANKVSGHVLGPWQAPVIAPSAATRANKHCHRGTAPAAAFQAGWQLTVGTGADAGGIAAASWSCERRRTRGCVCSSNPQHAAACARSALGGRAGVCSVLLGTSVLHRGAETKPAFFRLRQEVKTKPTPKVRRRDRAGI